MKTITRGIVLLSSKVRLITFVLTLVLFVIAAGAPACTGSVGG